MRNGWKIIDVGKTLVVSYCDLSGSYSEPFTRLSPYFCNQLFDGSDVGRIPATLTLDFGQHLAGGRVGHYTSAMPVTFECNGDKQDCEFPVPPRPGMKIDGYVSGIRHPHPPRPARGSIENYTRARLGITVCARNRCSGLDEIIPADLHRFTGIIWYLAYLTHAPSLAPKTEPCCMELGI